MCTNSTRIFCEKKKTAQTGGGKDKIMSLLIPEKLPDCIDKPVEKLLTPLAENAGKTLGDLWFLVMGGISNAADMRRAKYAANLAKLKTSLENKIDAIPLDQRVEPDIQISCQALEDAKYCAENEDIREMFTELISATMDKRSSALVHPSFSGILKQMTTDEAKFLLKIRENTVLPVCNIISTHKDSEIYNVLFCDLYFETIEPFETEIYDNAFIISVLSRQGLIDVSYSKKLANKSAYEVFENSLFFKSKSEWEENRGVAVNLEKGSIFLTSAGKRFLQVCCPTPKSDECDVISSTD